jgi:hypothetical protein
MRFRFNAKWFMAIMLITPMVIQALPVKVSGEMWGRLTNESSKQKNASGDYVDKISKNYMSLERGYFGLETTFSQNTKARFTVDMFSTDATHQYTTGGTDSAFPIDSLSTMKNGSVDGAGLKLKYAYVDFANLFPVPEMNLSVGLQKVYFGTIYDWNYTIIGKAPTDEYKVANSADYGVTLNGFIPNGYGEYAVGLYNGEGYKKVGASLSDNTDFAYLANLRLTPIGGLTVGGSYMTNSVKREKKLSGDALDKSYEEQALLDGVVRINYSILDIWGEYISKDMKFPNATNKDFTATGLMIMPIVSLSSLIEKDIQLLARFDTWDESENPTTTAKYLSNSTTIGANYNFMHDESNVPAMQLQLNYTTKTYDEGKSAATYADGKKDISQIMLQLKWRFASTIAN